MRQTESRKTKRIKQVSITNLFGIFNHVIPLNNKEHITIIHSPNGFGKTTILKLLNTLFSPSNRLLLNIPFDEFRVDFEDDTSFWVSKSPHSQASLELEQPLEQMLIFNCTGKKAYSLRSKPLLKDGSIASSSLPSRIEFLVPSLDRVAPDSWRYGRTGEILSLEDVIERFYDRLPMEIAGEREKLPQWLVDIRKAVPIRIIETQRLLSTVKNSRRVEYERGVAQEYAVTEDSRDLLVKIREKLADSAALSQSLDRTFPVRLISPTVQQQQVTERELLNKLANLEKERSRLMDVGLLDQETDTGLSIRAEQGIEPNTMSVLAVYAEDTERKLRVFDELADKIALLTAVINNHFLYKTMAVDKEKGIVFTNKNGKPVSLESLSSGEQHELVLFYELLFKVTPGSLILIDEPEISLHVVWQEHFLKDIQQVTHLTDIDVILATHSPDIISDRRDLLVELGEPVNGRI